ncbi:zinc finger protein 276 isoform X2 [Echeneis naucrates]|uniref:zinc finger protein 276 isoform X2 n=1 Tax=Echeneis naucrates TaxID=173247 RepID=UPI00111456FC|nr:zinc finger protein 276 isoform X2 [Echeneis naucrates]
MKKKGRRSRSYETSQQTSRTQMTVNVIEEKRTSGNRGRPRRPVPVTNKCYHSNAAMDNTVDLNFGVAAADDTQKHPETKSKCSGRLQTAICRLCHGKFSPRSLRHAFNRRSQDSINIIDNESDTAAQTPLLFHSDFQRLVGVQLNRDPQLSEFICKKCHTKFYKCHSILIRFLQRVNLPPVFKENLKSWKNAKCPESSVNQGSRVPSFITSDPECLHSLVSWAHHHGEACRSCPDLKEVLRDQCWGSVKTVWGCADGHRYIMDTQCTTATTPNYAMNFSSGALESRNDDVVMSEEEEELQQQEEKDKDEVKQPSGFGKTPAESLSTLAQRNLPAGAAQIRSTELADWASNNEGQEEAFSPALAQLEDSTADIEITNRAYRVTVPSKRRRSPKAPEELKIKKKPGPKPGWKNKFKPKGEELPNIYKCPYQGCTAVYRAPDGLKKHIKEHHEEVRERPCPHPGCNKVFMIDRYLQRHVKLIHTEERNYICDQCGQTFKQRKHLSVHQMRHSGAKPLQCEVCGFQCRQRASLKYHMTKHKAEADLEFACLICGKRFEKPHNLNVHMSMVHPLTHVEAQRGSNQQEHQPYSDLHTITLTGEVIQQDQDR